MKPARSALVSLRPLHSLQKQANHASRVNGPIDIGESGVKSLPRDQHNVDKFVFRWNGAPVPAQALFDPHALNPETILGERNAESRRVMIDLYGVDRLLSKLKLKIIDEDTDPGGPRRLVRVARLGRQRNVQFLDCRCPSTGRRYLLRVPNDRDTCHAAAAWMAGFDNPDWYRPIQET